MSERAAPVTGAGQRPSLNPAALSVADAALVLTRLGGGPVTEELIEADLEAGAPTNADGSINLVHYAAWLVREMGRRGD
ncbi:MAG: hypothetical protein KJZ54_05350 [Phycisphaerales bacterium]|nr:hypothetical protein [Phycisphaerales bacterium]